MSSDDGRVAADELLALARPVDVETLDTKSFISPWSGDVGSRAVQSTVFGNLELVLTHGDVVLHGQDIVQARRHQPDDDGLVPAVDLAAAGYSRKKAEAAVVAIRTHYDRDRADLAMLAELVTSLAETEPEAAIGAGWTGDDLDVLLASIEGSPFYFGEEDDPEEIDGIITENECPKCGFEW